MSIADTLITRGWHQGSYRDDNTGAVCLYGAIDVVYGRDWTQVQRAEEVVRDLIAQVGVARWNDTPSRTFDEVLRVAKEADEILDAS